MLLKQKSNGHMVEVVNIIELIDLNRDQVSARHQEGEDVQDIDLLSKQDLVFLSGEELPKCWKDPHYRDNELRR